MADFRCPANPSRLFGKTVDVDGEPLLIETEEATQQGALLEYACRDCRREQQVGQVLHRFDLSGRCVETVVTG